MHGELRPEEVETMLEAERPRLVRLCARLAGSGEAAEDLAQETLVEAWRHLHKLHDATGYSAWLSAIARNVCRRWTHAQGSESAPVATAYSQRYVVPSACDDEPADPYDFETDLERGELAQLLDRALALLPPATRTVLIKRYIEESPHAEIAASLGMTEGAVKVKVHRGKLALRRVLTTDLRVDAATFGILDLGTEHVQMMDLWCPVCGKHRLNARFRSDGAGADLRCPLCCTSQQVSIYGGVPTSSLRNLAALNIALGEKTEAIAGFFRTAMAGEQSLCPGCGRLVLVQVHPVHTGLATYQDVCHFNAECVSCHSTCGMSWRMVAQSDPRVRNFWQQHTRIYTLPPREIETEATQAIVTGFRSINGSTGLDVIIARNTLQFLGVHPTTGR